MNMFIAGIITGIGNNRYYYLFDIYYDTLHT